MGWHWVIFYLGVLFLGQSTAWAQEIKTTPPAMVAFTDLQAFEFPDLYEASIADLTLGLNNGLFTSVDLVKVRNNCPVIYFTDMVP